MADTYYRENNNLLVAIVAIVVIGLVAFGIYRASNANNASLQQGIQSESPQAPLTNPVTPGRP